MHKWIRKAKVVVGSAALVVALFGASLVPGVAYVPSAEAATSYDSVIMQADSTSDIDAKRGGKKDKDGMGPSGRRSRWG
jgi:hypothetical protein